MPLIAFVLVLIGFSIGWEPWVSHKFPSKPWAVAATCFGLAMLSIALIIFLIWIGCGMPRAFVPH